MKKIKIVHIIGRLGYGGAERLLLDICRKMDRDRFDVRVVSLQGGGPLLDLFEQANVPVTIFYKKHKGDFRVIKQTKAYLKKIKPDIVHTHLFLGDFFGGIAALRAGCTRIVSTKHDIMSEGFIRDFLSRYIRRKFSKIIAISHATRDFIVKKEKISIDNIVVIYNGIDMSKFHGDAETILRKDVITIGSIGRLSKEKGHKHLIRASRFIRDSHWKMLLVGDGPMRNELEHAVHLLDLEDKVTFVGVVADVRPYLHDIDVFVLPSVSEGLSLAVIEAAATGAFVIATNVGGVPEIIRDNETGLLFQPKNIEQLVKHLNWVFENRNEARAMAKRLQEETTKRFDINTIIHEYEAMYDALERKQIKQ